VIRTLVVDDERIARVGLRTLLADEGKYQVVGECANGVHAAEQIRALAPELVFLDVQMPDLDGFGVLRALTPAELPAVVFVTAYDQYALEAFEANAIDYLLKPFDRPRLRQALARVDRFLGQPNQRAQIAALLDALETRGVRPRASARADRIIVKDRTRVTFVDPNDVAWVESDGNYVKVCAKGRVHLIRDTIRAFEQRLDALRFLRVSRSVIVNIDEVREMRRAAGNQYLLIMKSGHQLASSRRYRGRIGQVLRQNGHLDAAEHHKVVTDRP
jgi:two-component system LytT family response regulator